MRAHGIWSAIPKQASEKEEICWKIARRGRSFTPTERQSNERTRSLRESGSRRPLPAEEPERQRSDEQRAERGQGGGAQDLARPEGFAADAELGEHDGEDQRDDRRDHHGGGAGGLRHQFAGRSGGCEHACHHNGGGESQCCEHDEQCHFQLPVWSGVFPSGKEAPRSIEGRPFERQQDTLLHCTDVDLAHIEMGQFAAAGRSGAVSKGGNRHFDTRSRCYVLGAAVIFPLRRRIAVDQRDENNSSHPAGAAARDFRRIHSAGFGAPRNRPTMPVGKK